MAASRRMSNASFIVLVCARNATRVVCSAWGVEVVTSATGSREGKGLAVHCDVESVAAGWETVRTTW